MIDLKKAREMCAAAVQRNEGIRIDIEFAAFSRTALPEALDEIEQLRQDCLNLEGLLKDADELSSELDAAVKSRQYWLRRCQKLEERS